MNWDHHRAPLYEAMIDYQKRVRGNFHVPGHKQGNIFDPEGKDVYASLLKLDATEVANLDDLHDANGVIAEAQQLAADAFGAEQTIFLVGGTTAGNLASLLHLCQPEDEVLIQRSSHQSIFHGCMLAGVKPVYIRAPIDQRTGFEQPLDPQLIDDVLKQNRMIKGVWVTSPSYFGVNQPLSKIANICHRYHVPLIVDEAHGAHYSFHQKLPPSAIQSGADLAIQSTHKMLTSMTMSSMMHLQGKRVKHSELTRWLRVIESSSPSYPLMASLDLARREMVLRGAQKLERVLRHLSKLRKKINSSIYFDELIYDAQQDPFKMSLVVRDSGITGFTLSSYLEQKGIFAELADQEKLLLVFSLGTTQSECEYFWQVITSFAQLHPKEKEVNHKGSFPLPVQISKAVCAYTKIRQAQKIKLPLKKSVGRVAVEMVIPYPPGIPAILPGEIISREMVERIIAFIDLGGKVRGIEKDRQQYIYVMS